MSIAMRLIPLIALAAVLAGCATIGGATYGRIPEIREASVTPAELQVGQDGVITVRIQDYHGIVDRVDGVVREDPRLTLALEKVEDAPTSVWRLDVEVPPDAPPGDFEIEFTAYDARGEVILVPHEDGHDTPLRATTHMRVVYPDDEDWEAPADN